MADQRNGGIAWTDQTWNPTRGCSLVSQGCVNCYAEKVAKRFSGTGQPYEGLVNERGAWNGVLKMAEDHLGDPLRWKRPRRVFVNSMSDLFHEAITNEQIAAVFGVMAASPQHQFQVLTKRPERMLQWFEWAKGYLSASRGEFPATFTGQRELLGGVTVPASCFVDSWPIPNAWLGVSIENQRAANERIPLLLQTPAAVRFLSVEPLLGPVDLGLDAIERSIFFHKKERLHPCDYACGGFGIEGGIEWVIVGGESGPGARRCDVAWIREIVAQCQAAEVPVFVKQLGANIEWDFSHGRRPINSKGADPSEWPTDLRVQQFPKEARP